MNLICFPHAGALHDPYVALATLLKGRMAVHTCMPIESRLSVSIAQEYVANLLRDNSQLFDRPHVLFGHSAGGLLAIECARQLAGSAMVRHLVVASTSGLTEQVKVLAAASDSELIEFVRTLKHTSDELLRNKDFRSLLLQTLRRDFRLMNTFREFPAIPISVLELWGSNERFVDGSPYWQRIGSPHTFRVLHGDHFHPLNRPRQIAEVILSEVFGINRTAQIAI